MEVVSPSGGARNMGITALPIPSSTSTGYWPGHLHFVIPAKAEIRSHTHEAWCLRLWTPAFAGVPDAGFSIGDAGHYGHSIELFVKAALGNAANLAERFQSLIKAEFDCDVPDWVGNRLRELAVIDPGSTAFRHGQNYDKTSKRDLPVDGEYHVNLAHLPESLRALSTAFIGVVMAIGSGDGKSAKMGADKSNDRSAPAFHSSSSCPLGARNR